MKHFLAVALGGAAGSVLCFWLTEASHSLAGRYFPYGTLLVNVLGCLFMGDCLCSSPNA